MLSAAPEGQPVRLARLTRAGWWTLGLGGAALVFGLATENEMGLWALSLLWSYLAVVHGYTRRCAGGIGLTVTVPRTAHARTSRGARIRIENHGAWSLLGFELSVAIGQTARVEHSETCFVPGHGHREIEAPVRLLYRGYYDKALVRLRSSPFSLSEVEVIARVPIDLTVYPAVQTIERESLPPGQPLRAVGDRVLPLPGQDVEFLGVRDYSHGDSLRIVHWPSVARTGKLVVKEFARSSECDVTLVVDLVRAGAPWPPEVNDDLTSVAASLAFHFHTRGLKVGLLMGSSPEIAIPPDVGDRHHAKVQTALATVSCGTGKGVLELLERQDSRLDPGGSLVVLTIPAATQGPLMDHLDRVAARGIRTLLVRLGMDGAGRDGPGIGARDDRRREAQDRGPARGPGVRIFDLDRPLKLEALLLSLG